MFFLSLPDCISSNSANLARNTWHPEVGIYKRKQESKKTRKQVLDQESDQEKKKVFSFFLGRFLCRVLVFLIVILVEFLFSFFLDRFLGRVLFFFFSCFLTFLFTFINSHLRFAVVDFIEWTIQGNRDAIKHEGASWKLKK